MKNTNQEVIGTPHLQGFIISPPPPDVVGIELVLRSEPKSKVIDQSFQKTHVRVLGFLKCRNNFDPCGSTRLLVLGGGTYL